MLEYIWWYNKVLKNFAFIDFNEPYLSQIIGHLKVFSLV